MSQRLASFLFWLCLASVFVLLRVDNTPRLYFLGDDNLVANLCDTIVSSGNWQPDWNRAIPTSAPHPFFEQESQRTALPHAHHYNFTTHILISAAALKGARSLSWDIPTATLLHHIAFFWDSISLLCIILCGRALGGTLLAGVAASLYALFPLAVQGSHYARPDAFLTAISSALLLLTLLRPRLPSTAWAMGCGGLLALAVICKASQLLLGLLPALAWLSVWLTASNKRTTTVTLLKEGGVLTSTVLLVVFLLFQLANIHWQDFVISVQSISLYYYHPAPPDVLEHFSTLNQLKNIGHYAVSTLGLPLLLFTVLGSAWQLTKHGSNGMLLVLPIVALTAYFATVPTFFDRSFCVLSANVVLLAAYGITGIANRLTLASPVAATLLTLLCSITPIQINYHLQTDHLRQHHNDDRLAFQNQLKSQWPGFWLKPVNRGDIFSRQLPAKPEKMPRIYIVEDFNDSNSRDYAAQLRDNGFVQIATFTGDFVAVPTSSLLTVHEAARYRYFIRQDEWPANAPLPKANRNEP